MKYKEFWIADYVIGQAVIDNSKIRSSFDKPGDLREIHVIEYQAYEKLQKQNEKLKSTLKIYAAEGLYDPLVGQRLTVENAKLIYHLGGTARDALKEIEESNG